MALSKNEELVLKGFDEVLGEKNVDTTSEGFQYWVKQLEDTTDFVTEDNLFASIGRGAQTDIQKESARTWSFAQGDDTVDTGGEYQIAKPPPVMDPRDADKMVRDLYTEKGLDIYQKDDSGYDFWSEGLASGQYTPDTIGKAIDTAATQWKTDNPYETELADFKAKTEADTLAAETAEAEQAALPVPDASTSNLITSGEAGVRKGLMENVSDVGTNKRMIWGSDLAHKMANRGLGPEQQTKENLFTTDQQAPVRRTKKMNTGLMNTGSGL